MFPSFRQRMMVLFGVIAAGWLCVQSVPVARAADGSDGLVILGAAAPVRALVAVVAVMAAATVVSGFVGAWGNPLAGPFTLAASLAIAAASGGSIDQWLGTHGSREGYLHLAAEAVVWGVFMVLAVEASMGLSGRLARWVLRSREASDPEQVRAEIESYRRQSGIGGSGWIAMSARMVKAIGEVTRLGPQAVQSMLGPAVTVLVGSLLTFVFLRSTDSWQVIWGLAFAYGLAALLAHQLAPLAPTKAMLLSPLAAAVLWYLAIALTAGNPEEILQAHYLHNFWAPGLALPAHYASAGVAGVAAGLGCSQVIWRTRIEERPGTTSQESPSPASA